MPKTDVSGTGDGKIRRRSAKCRGPELLPSPGGDISPAPATAEISPLTAVAIVCLGIASYLYNPTPSQIGTLAGAAVGGLLVTAFSTHPVGAVAGVVAGGVAGYRFASDT